MRFAAFFLWILGPLGLWLAVTLWGMPHAIVSYRFDDNGDPYNPRAQRHYRDCTYYGWAGVISVPAIDAQCPWVRFFKAGS